MNEDKITEIIEKMQIFEKKLDKIETSLDKTIKMLEKYQQQEIDEESIKDALRDSEERLNMRILDEYEPQLKKRDPSPIKSKDYIKAKCKANDAPFKQTWKIAQLILKKQTTLKEVLENPTLDEYYDMIIPTDPTPRDIMEEEQRQKQLEQSQRHEVPIDEEIKRLESILERNPSKKTLIEVKLQELYRSKNNGRETIYV